MYITIAELKTALYEYQQEQIAEGDHDILAKDIAAAEEEAFSYISGRYDVDAIRSQPAEARNPLLLEHIKSIAVWYLVRLSNPDVIWDKAKAYYENAIDWLNRVANGKLNPSLPPIDADNDGMADGGLSWGSDDRYDNSY